MSSRLGGVSVPDVSRAGAPWVGAGRNAADESGNKLTGPMPTDELLPPCGINVGSRLMAGAVLIPQFSGETNV
jgi:hypothetical protein